MALTAEVQAYLFIAFLVGTGAFFGCLFGAVLGVYVGLRIGGRALVDVIKEL